MKAKKHFGQNWLIDETVVADIVAAGEIDSNTPVIEIGPGTGLLTKQLLSAGAELMAVEKDRDLIDELNNLKLDYPNHLHIYNHDIRDLKAVDLVGNRNYQVIANIPYYITGLIIRQFLSDEHQPNSLVLLIQREVADRIIAADNKESLLSISVKVYGVPRKIRNVKAGAFRPIPSVDSAVIKIDRVNRSYFIDNNIDEAKFFEVLRGSFNQKRKTLRASINLNPEHPLSTRRPETLDLGEWREVYRTIYP